MAAIVIDALLINNDNDIGLLGFKDSRVAGTDVGDYANAATVTYRILTASGTEFKAATTMSYVAGSKGEYLGVLEKADAADLVEHGIYYIEISAAESGLEGFWREQTVAKHRET